MERKILFNTLEQQLFDVCKTEPGAIEKIEALLRGGADVNHPGLVKPGHSLLAEIILGFGRYGMTDVLNCCKQCRQQLNTPVTGNQMVRIIRLFLEYGFDVSRENGAYGGECLYSLLYSTYDAPVLEAARLLLQAGADPTWKKEGTTLEQLIKTERSAAWSIHKNRFRESLYFSFHLMIKAAAQHQNPARIHLFTDCIGQRISGVLLCCNPEDPCSPIHVQPMENRECLPGLKSAGKRYCFRDVLVFEGSRFPLCLEPSNLLYSDSAVLEESRCLKKPPELTEPLQDCIGQRIVDIRLDNRTVIQKSVCYGQPIVYLQLENGKTLFVSTNYGEVPLRETAAYFEVLEPCKNQKTDILST